VEKWRGPQADGRGFVVFVHGLWMHAQSWQSWVELFDRSGYDCISTAWPGESPTVAACRSRPGLMSGVGIEQVLDEAARVIGAQAPRQPIVIGHGTGGLIGQILLSRNLASSAIALAPMHWSLMPWPSLLGAGHAWPGLRHMIGYRRAVMPTPVHFSHGFANTIEAAEANGLYEQYVIPAACRPLTQTMFAGHRWRSPACVNGAANRGPLLLVSGGRDACTREAAVGALERRYRRRLPDAITDHQVFPGRGHSLAVDSRWRDVAYYCLDWLTRQNL